MCDTTVNVDLVEVKAAMDLIEYVNSARLSNIIWWQGANMVNVPAVEIDEWRVVDGRTNWYFAEDLIRFPETN